MAWRGANVGEPDWATLRDAKIQLNKDVEKGVSSYFAPHPDQTITVRRGDLQALLYDSNDYSKELRQEIKECESMSGRHFNACRSAVKMRRVIEAMDKSPIQAELLNQLGVLLRMVLIQNGAQVSPQKLNHF